MSLKAAWQLGRIAALVALVACLYALGFSAGGDRELARAGSLLVAAEQAAAKSHHAQLARLRTQVRQANAANLRLEQKLGERRQQTRTVYRTIRREAPHVVAQTLSEALHGEQCRCDVGPAFVELWDRASDPARAAASAASPATGVALGQAATTDPALRVSLDAVLQNHIDNAELATETREQLEALIDWHLNPDEALHE